jgi:integrase
MPASGELRRYPVVIGEDRIFPPKQGAVSGRQRVEGSFEDLLERAGIEDFRFHDLRHTFASWYMMNGGDLYELAKILGHSNIKMTERYAKLARQHIARTGSTAREMWDCWNNRSRWKQQRPATRRTSCPMFAYSSHD